MSMLVSESQSHFTLFSHNYLHSYCGFWPVNENSFFFYPMEVLKPAWTYFYFIGCFPKWNRIFKENVTWDLSIGNCWCLPGFLGAEKVITFWWQIRKRNRWHDLPGSLGFWQCKTMFQIINPVVFSLRCDDESPYAACAEGTLAESSSGEDQAHQEDLAQAQVVFG